MKKSFISARSLSRYRDHTISRTPAHIFPLACVLDKDGTLLNPHTTWAPVIRATCAAMPNDTEYMYKLLGFDSQTNTFVDKSTFMVDNNETILKMLEENGVDSKLFQSIIREQPIFSEPVMDIKQLVADIRELDLYVAMLTSDDRVNTELFLREMGVEMDAIVCGDDGRGRKPTGDPLIAIASDLDIPLETLVMVGDSSHDIDSGKAVGARTVGVLTGVGVKETLNADKIIDSVVELPEVLCEWVCENAYGF